MMEGAPMIRCSDAWDDLPAWGSATQASFWVALEQPGPWGRDALTESHLDPALGARLAASSTAAGGKVLLIRTPGHHADRYQSRRVFLAGGLAAAPWLVAGAALTPGALEGLPWDTLAEPDPGPLLAACPWLRPASRPVLLVCANSRRDVCCALKGRPVAVEASAQRPGQVWECSHTGGHRFAPTGILLPSGQMLARLTSGLALEALDAAASGRLATGTLGSRHDRGRSHLPQAVAAAESWVRSELRETRPGGLAAVATDDPSRVRVTHEDGRVGIGEVEGAAAPDRPESCGKGPVPARVYRVGPARP